MLGALLTLKHKRGYILRGTIGSYGRFVLGKCFNKKRKFNSAGVITTIYIIAYIFGTLSIATLGLSAGLEQSLRFKGGHIVTQWPNGTNLISSNSSRLNIAVEGSTVSGIESHG